MATSVFPHEGSLRRKCFDPGSVKLKDVAESQVIDVFLTNYATVKSELSMTNCCVRKSLDQFSPVGLSGTPVLCNQRAGHVDHLEQLTKPQCPFCNLGSRRGSSDPSNSVTVLTPIVSESGFEKMEFDYRSRSLKLITMPVAADEHPQICDHRCAQACKDHCILHSPEPSGSSAAWHLKTLYR